MSNNRNKYDFSVIILTPSLPPSPSPIVADDIQLKYIEFFVLQLSHKPFVIWSDTNFRLVSIHYYCYHSGLVSSLQLIKLTLFDAFICHICVYATMNCYWLGILRREKKHEQQYTSRNFSSYWMGKSMIHAMLLWTLWNNSYFFQ